MRGDSLMVFGHDAAAAALVYPILAIVRQILTVGRASHRKHVASTCMSCTEKGIWCSRGGTHH